MYKMKKENLSALFQKIAEEQELFVPVKSAGQTSFALWDEGADVDLETLKTAQAASAHWINEHGTDDTPEANALRSRIADLFTRAEGTMN